MNPISTPLIAVALLIAFAAPSIAQEDKTLGTVVNGNTTIVFKAADASDLDMQKLSIWSAFASEHPDIARALAYKPALVDDDGYANKHPALRAFFSAHPDVREAMAANPGNYNAIPPRAGE